MKFQQRPSGAKLYLGPACIKVGPDSAREAQLLNLVASKDPTLVPEVLWSGRDSVVLELLEPAKANDLTKLDFFMSALPALWVLDIKDPEWRLVSIEDYQAYCLYPRHERTPQALWDFVAESTPRNVQRPLFLHGDATLSNSVLVGDRVHQAKLLDLSVRPSSGDIRQDMSKLFFSVCLGFDTNFSVDHYHAVTQVFHLYCDASRRITDFAFAWHLAANMLRVLRKEPLSECVMSEAAHVLLNFVDLK